jgi:GNAT superfamily N-acetyltransferase
VEGALRDLFRGRHYGDQGVTVDIGNVTVRDGRVTYIATLRRDGRRVGHFVRTMHQDADGTFHVRNEDFALNRGARKHGVSTAIAQDLEAAYPHGTVIEASFQRNGGYAGARAGFDFADEGEATRLVTRLDRLLRRHPERYSAAERDAATDAIERARTLPFGHEHHPTAFELSDIGRAAGGPGRPHLGQQLLDKHPWNGRKVLDPAPSTRRPTAPAAEPHGPRPTEPVATRPAGDRPHVGRGAPGRRRNVFARRADDGATAATGGRGPVGDLVHPVPPRGPRHAGTVRRSVQELVGGRTLSNGATLDVRWARPLPDRVEFLAEITQDGQRVGHVSQVWVRSSDGTLWVDNMGTWLRPELRGRGLAGEVEGPMEELYRTAGVDHVKAHGNTLDGSAYDLATRGYRWTHRGDAERIIEHLADRVRTDPTITPHEARWADDIVDRGRRFDFDDPRHPTVAEIADIGRGASADPTVPHFGQRVFDEPGMSWHGRKDFGAPQAPRPRPLPDPRIAREAVHDLLATKQLGGVGITVRVEHVGQRADGLDVHLAIADRNGTTVGWTVRSFDRTPDGHLAVTMPFDDLHPRLRGLGLDKELEGHLAGWYDRIGAEPVAGPMTPSRHVHPADAWDEVGPNTIVDTPETVADIPTAHIVDAEPFDTFAQEVAVGRAVNRRIGGPVGDGVRLDVRYLAMAPNRTDIHLAVFDPAWQPVGLRRISFERGPGGEVFVREGFSDLHPRYRTRGIDQDIDRRLDDWYRAVGVRRVEGTTPVPHGGQVRTVRELDPVQAIEPPATTRVYRFHDPADPCSLRARSGHGSPTGDDELDALRQDPERWRELSHRQMTSGDTPLTSVTTEPFAASLTPDDWLSGIINGIGPELSRRAPAMSHFDVPTNRLVAPERGNSLSRREHEYTFAGDDLARFRTRSEPNPYGPVGLRVDQVIPRGRATAADRRLIREALDNFVQGHDVFNRRTFGSDYHARVHDLRFRRNVTTLEVEVLHHRQPVGITRVRLQRKSDGTYRASHMNLTPGSGADRRPFDVNFLAHSEDWYRASNVSEVRVAVNGNEGLSFSVVSRGFSWTTEDDASIVLNRLGQHLHDPDLPHQERVEIEAIFIDARRHSFGSLHFPSAGDVLRIGRRPGLRGEPFGARFLRELDVTWLASKPLS